MDLTHSLFLEEDRNITSPPQVIPFINVNSINLPVLKTECHLQLIHLQSNGGLDTTRQQQTARRDYCCVSWSSGGRTAQTDRRYQDVNRPTNSTSGAPTRQVRNLTGVKQVDPVGQDQCSQQHNCCRDQRMSSGRLDYGIMGFREQLLFFSFSW